MKIQMPKLRSINIIPLMLLFVMILISMCNSDGRKFDSHIAYTEGQRLFVRSCSSCHIGKDSTVNWTSYSLIELSEFDTLQLKNKIFRIEEEKNHYNYFKGKFGEQEKNALYTYIKEKRGVVQ